MHDDVLDELELLEVARQRNHYLWLHVPALVLLLHVDGGADDGLRLHDGDFRIRHAETAAAVAHHRVELVERVDDVLDAADRLVHRLREKRDLVLGVRHELVQRRVEEADRHRLALERLEELLEVVLLVRQYLRERDAALLNRVGADHLAERRDAALREEHVLRAAEADAFCAKLAGLLGVARRVGVRAHLELAELVGPHHDAAELADDRRVDSRNHAVVDVAGRTVDREPVALLERLAGEDELLVLLVHHDLLAAGDAALAHAARDDRRV